MQACSILRKVRGKERERGGSKRRRTKGRVRPWILMRDLARMQPRGKNGQA